MKHSVKLNRWLAPTLGGLALAVATSTGFGQYTNNPARYDSPAELTSWLRWWGTVDISWDSTLDAQNNPNSGSMKFVANFTGASGEQFMTWGSIATNQQWDGSIRIDATLYTNFSFDIKVPEGTPPTRNGNYGPLEVGLMYRNDSWQFGTIPLRTYTVPLSATNWTHVDNPIPNNLPNLNMVCGYFLKMWSNGAYTNTAIFNFDNLYIQAPDVPITNPPPTLTLQATVPGLQLISTSLGGPNARYSIRTAAPYYSWVNSPTSTTYAVTIKDYPRNPYNYFQTHIFLIPAGSLPYGPGDAACDWNSANAVFVSIQNTAAGGGYARFMWKTNVTDHSTWGANQVWNRTNPPIPTLSSATILGTWSLTFDQNTNVTFRAPDNTVTNFTLPAEAIPWFTDVAGLYAYVGIQPNGAGNVGQSAVLDAVRITGAVDGSGSPAPDIEDRFLTPPLDTFTWGTAASDANGIQVVGADTPFWLLWTLPDAGYEPQWSPDLPPTYGWMDPYLSPIQLGTLKRALVPLYLSFTNTAFFRLYNATLDTPSSNIVAFERFDLNQGSNHVTIPMFKMSAYQIGELIRTAPDGAFVAGPAGRNDFTPPGGWADPTMLLPPGADFEFNNPDPALWQVTFVGEVVSGPPVILLDPVGATVGIGDNVQLTALAGGDPTLRYQWRREGTDLGGETTYALHLTNVQPDQAGSYTLRVTNTLGEAVSAPAQLVVVNPAATLSPTGRTNGVFGFQVNGLANRQYVIERATDLSAPAWTPVYTNADAQVPFWFSEPASASENRFYRALYVPRR